MSITLPRNSLEIAGINPQDPVLIRLLESSDELPQESENIVTSVPDINPDSPDLLVELQACEEPGSASTSIANMDPSQEHLKKAARIVRDVEQEPTTRVSHQMLLGKRSPEVVLHERRTAVIGVLGGIRFGLSPERLTYIARVLEHHDPGRVVDPFIRKVTRIPRRFTPEERKVAMPIIRPHAEIGARLLEGIPGWDDSTTEDVARGVESHHSDSAVDPYGPPFPKDREIEGQIITVADEADALLSPRYDRKPFPKWEARQTLLKQVVGAEEDPIIIDTMFPPDNERIM